MAKVNLSGLVIQPHIFCGVKSVCCNEEGCGWEATFIVPEEAETMVISILRHLIEDHHIKMPLFTVTTH